MKKKIGYIVLALVTLIIIGSAGGLYYFNQQWFKERPNYLKLEFEPSSIRFEWDKDTHNEYTELHSAMLVPVKLQGIRQICYMQFVTGAPTPFFAEKPWHP